MPRGGRRQGTPGRGYQNRTDLMSNYDQGQAPAVGGQAPVAPAAAPDQAPGPTGLPQRSPDQSPSLSDPSTRPGEPITAGLSSGAGPGPDALGMDPRLAETRAVATKWIPLLRPIIDDPETPESVKLLFRYMAGA